MFDVWWKKWCEAFVSALAADSDSAGIFGAQGKITSTQLPYMTSERVNHAVGTAYKSVTFFKSSALKNITNLIAFLSRQNRSDSAETPAVCVITFLSRPVSGS